MRKAIATATLGFQCSQAGKRIRDTVSAECDSTWKSPVDVQPEPQSSGWSLRLLPRAQLVLEYLRLTDCLPPKRADGGKCIGRPAAKQRTAMRLPARLKRLEPMVFEDRAIQRRGQKCQLKQVTTA